MKDFIVFKSPGTLLRIPPTAVVYIRQDENYSVVYQVDGQTRLLTYSLDEMELELARQLRDHASGHSYVRLGSGLIVNTRYVYQINVPNGRLILSDAATFKYELSAATEALKKLIELLTPADA